MPVPPPDRPYDYHFPKAGLHKAGPFGQQPVRQEPRQLGGYTRTTAEAVNVVGYDPVSGRDRGGSRPGLSKFVAAAVNPTISTIAPDGVFVVQELRLLASTHPEASPSVPQQSPSGRVVYLVAVSQGVVKTIVADATSWNTPTNNSGQTPALNATGVMMSAANNQKLFFADGINYRYFNPATNSVENWTTTAGSLPRDGSNNGARLICTWRGRTVLSGVLKDPQNYFMSKVSDPFNYNYQPNPTTATDAFIANNSKLGLIGDVITALIPYTDDILIFGGDHTLWQMRGDPKDGGRVDCISEITGIAFGEAWCMDPYGTIYFFGNRPSVWRIVPGSGAKPERISQPIEPLLANVNTGTNIIRMVWNDRQQQVELFITHDSEQAETTHYYWDYRLNAWYQRLFANTDHNPLCCVAYDGNDADDRAVCIGCWDGFVRFIDHTADTDDGTEIESSVLIGPIMTPTLDDMMLKELQFVLAEASGEVNWEVLAGDTAEAAVTAAARASGTAVAGRGSTQPIRVASHAIYIRLSSTNRWAMETVRAVFGTRGKVRGRGHKKLS